MGYRLARMVLLSVLIVLPLLVRAAGAPASSGRQAVAWSQVAPILGVELLLLGGVLVADWNRRRLLAEYVRRIERAKTRVQTRPEPVRPPAKRFSIGPRRSSAADTL